MAEETKHTKQSGEEEEEDSKIFPQKLMEILSDEDFSSAICWLPHGKAFIIRNRTLFAEQIMPKFFSRKAKYSSFTRKLNRWNFVRVSSGPELGAYYHEFFLRDKPHLAAQMFCKNARSKLAMANEVAAPPSTTHVGNNVGAAAAVHMMPKPQAAPMSSIATLPPAVLAALQKEGQESSAMPFDLKTAAPVLGVSNLQLLERQIQIMQEEQAQRMFYQQMYA